MPSSVILLYRDCSIRDDDRLPQKCCEYELMNVYGGNESLNHFCFRWVSDFWYIHRTINNKLHEHFNSNEVDVSDARVQTWQLSVYVNCNQLCLFCNQLKKSLVDQENMHCSVHNMHLCKQRRSCKAVRCVRNCKGMLGDCALGRVMVDIMKSV
jgi:hypothetical protein